MSPQDTPSSRYLPSWQHVPRRDGKQVESGVMRIYARQKFRYGLGCSACLLSSRRRNEQDREPKYISHQDALYTGNTNMSAQIRGRIRSQPRRAEGLAIRCRRDPGAIIQSRGPSRSLSWSIGKGPEPPYADGESRCGSQGAPGPGPRRSA